MRGESRSERTARLLSQRLEDLAETLERSGASTKSVGRLIELASVATLHAVQLDLISAENAGSIWDGVERRHPALRRVDRRLAERPRARSPRRLAA
jgi:hypothetical protein